MEKIQIPFYTNGTMFPTKTAIVQLSYFSVGLNTLAYWRSGNKTIQFNFTEAIISKNKAHITAQQYHNQRKHFLPPLKIGQLVSVQDPHTNTWRERAHIISTRPDGQSYIILLINNDQQFI